MSLAAPLWFWQSWKTIQNFGEKNSKFCIGFENYGEFWQIKSYNFHSRRQVLTLGGVYIFEGRHSWRLIHDQLVIMKRVGSVLKMNSWDTKMVPLPDSNLEQKQKPSAILVTASPSECAVLASTLLPIFEKSSVSSRSLNLSKRTSSWLIACWCWTGGGETPGRWRQSLKKIGKRHCWQTWLRTWHLIWKGHKNESFTQRQL